MATARGLTVGEKTPQASEGIHCADEMKANVFQSGPTGSYSGRYRQLHNLPHSYLPRLLSATVIIISLLSAIAVAQSNQAAPSQRSNPVDWVNPYIGTAGAGSDYGGTMPLVTTPFGMTNWGGRPLASQVELAYLTTSQYNETNYKNPQVNSLYAQAQADPAAGPGGYRWWQPTAW